jgi:hypothetical protein
MDHPFYNNISVSKDRSMYEFVSTGKKGKIHKVVQFTEFYDYVNLGLGDRLPNGKIDFKTVTDNGDVSMIMATVVQIILKYTRYFPQNTISIYGSNKIRMLLYERAIRNNYKELNVFFDIWGIREDHVKEVFNPSISYFGFLVKRK